MYKRTRILVVIGLSLFFLLTSASGSIASPLTSSDISTSYYQVTNAPVVENAKGDQEVAGDSVLLQYGPSGGLITVSLGGILMIIRAYNDGKKIEVTTYKERYSELKDETEGELNKLRIKVAALETDNTALTTLLDATREALETRKAHFTEVRLDNEAVHRNQIESLNAVLLQEIRIRHMLERVLAEHDIALPTGTELTTRDKSNT